MYYSDINMYNNTYEPPGKNTFLHFSLLPSTSDLYPSLSSLISFAVVASLVAQTVKHLPVMWETQVRSLSWEDPLKKEMATHSSTLASKYHGWRSLVGYNPWGRKESDTTERLHSPFLSFSPSHVRLYPTVLSREAECYVWFLRMNFLIPWRLHGSLKNINV